MTMLRFGLVTSVGLITLLGCSEQESPLITMCQGITKQLVSTPIDSWNKVTRDDSAGDEARVDLQFPTGVSSCYFAREESVGRNATPDEELDFAGSPYKVTLNGQPVSDMDVIRASAGVTGKMIKQAAEETSQRVSDIAENADQKAQEFASQAGDKLRDFTNTATEKAKDAALKATEAVQEQLQN